MSSKISSNRTYNPSIVPPYLQGRPRKTILHCINRKASANKYIDTDITGVDLQAGIFAVKKHMVNFGIADGNPSCTCKDWISHHIPCKHFFGVFRFKEEWSWSSLPKCYLDSAYLSIDHSAISSYVNQPEPDNTDLTLDEHELKSLYCPRELSPETESQKREDTSVNNYPRQASFTLAEKVFNFMIIVLESARFGEESSNYSGVSQVPYI